MESYATLCYREFLALYRRSGGGLVAESKVSRDIENRFGKLFVPHLADVEILSWIESVSKEKPFLLQIIGVPGVGKTKLLTELINGLQYEDFEKRYQDIVKRLVSQFCFEDISRISEKKPNTSGKKRVWVTLNIDEYVGVTAGQNPLKDLHSLLNKFLAKNESLVISGNVGVLENEEAKQSVIAISRLIELRNSPRQIEIIRFPNCETLYWTKEYGIEIKKTGIAGDPFFLVSGPGGFQSYCRELIKLFINVLTNCCSKAPKRDCQDCVGLTYLQCLNDVNKLLENEDFANRLHDILQYLWLKNTDVYLVARALNIFWGYALTELWDEIGQGGINNQSRLAIFNSLYFSKMPSLYRVGEYPLSQTNIHRFRNKSFEETLLKTRERNFYTNPRERLKKRLEYYFQLAENNQYRGMIYGGIFDEFVDDKKLATMMSGIARRIILLRLDKALIYVSDNDNRLNEIFKEPWGFSKILFATKVNARKIDSKKPDLPLLVIHESVSNEIDSQSGVIFEEIQTYAHYLSKREKILQLKLRGSRVSPDLQKKAPCLHLGIDDYASLRELTRGVGNPDITLRKSTQVKVASFIDGIEGFVTHEIRPLIWNHLKEDLTRGDTSHILTRTLGPTTKRCEIKLSQGRVYIELDGEPIGVVGKGAVVA